VIASLGWRLLLAVPVLLLATLLLFVVLRVLPADVAAMALAPGATEAEIAAMRAALGLDWLLPVQYVIWLGQMLSGEWGLSAQLGVPVARLVGTALPATLELAVLALVLCGVLGVAGGLLLFALRRQGGQREGRAALAETGTALLMAVPALLWALLLVLVFALAWPVAPVGGRLAPGLAWPPGTGFLLLDALLAGDGAAFGSALGHLVLPAVALGLTFAPPVMRVLGVALAEAHRAPFIDQARLRGLSGAQVLFGQALPLAAVPALAALGRQFGLLLGGAAVVEAVCGYPGLGRLLVEAVRAADLPVLQAAGLAFAVVAVLAQAVVEGVCRGLAPRVRA
jgi:ABC-type dipeptide/oligopeptide/nickel transport system permease component